MTKETRKYYGKQWALADKAFQERHSGFKQYYDEFKVEIDKEISEDKGVKHA